jgi:hypothetical protein
MGTRFAATLTWVSTVTKYYKDYIWKGGIPYGVREIKEPEKVSNLTAYKILMDPYRKRISIEEYVQGRFSKIIYDSALLDFRNLKSEEHIAWQKSIVSETGDTIICMIRNQDDRIVFIEKYLFEKNLCRECHVSSPHGYPLSFHKMLYKKFGEPFDGVILYDCNEHPVMRKRYQFDEEAGEFTELIEESWDLG